MKAEAPGAAVSKPLPKATQREGSTGPAETATEKGASRMSKPATNTLTESGPATVGDIVE